LQQALDRAASGDEILLAQGAYRPSRPTDPTDPRTATFRLDQAIAIYGGFPAGGGAWERRDPKRFLTILSGNPRAEEARDPLWWRDNWGSDSDHYHHVVTLEGSTEGKTTTLDGLIISGGVARGYPPDNDGGGMLVRATGNIRVLDCVFQYNMANQGGAVAVTGRSDQGHLTFDRCRFYRNVAQYTGGGIYIRQSQVTFRSCHICANIANHGGAVYYESEYPSTFVNCVVQANAAMHCAGILRANNLTFNLVNPPLHLINCTITGNLASEGPRLSAQVQEIEFGDEDYLRTVDDLFVRPPLIQQYYCLNTDSDHEAELLLTHDGHLTSAAPFQDKGEPNEAYGDPLPPGTEPQWDLDGENRVVGKSVDFGADEFLDSDGDGLPDWWERDYFGDTGAAEPNEDPDGDGLANWQEYEFFGSDPVAVPLRVNGNRRRDPHADGSDLHPFTTLQSGIDAAREGDTVLVAPGTYRGPGNRDIDFQGKAVVLKSVDGPEKTIVDCEGIAPGFSFQTRETSATALIGFQITRADHHAVSCWISQPQILDCWFVRNGKDSNDVGALWAIDAAPRLDRLRFSQNVPSALACRRSRLYVDGDIDLSGDRLWLQGTGSDSVELCGAGIIHLAEGGDVICDAGCHLQCNLQGPGRIYVSVSGALTVEGEAIVDLADPTNADKMGRIDAQGLLLLRDQVELRNARVHVHRTSFEDTALVSNCVITAEAGAPYGQFYLEGDAKVLLDHIVADGDRYLDVDPATFDCNNITVRIIDINVTEGIGDERGGMFELRGLPDLIPPTQCLPEENHFLCGTSEIQGFDTQSWALNRLTLQPGSRVNLTNRFDFHSPFDTGGADEALYVKSLVLGAGSVLNTAYNRVYFETIDVGPEAKIVNIPLLGFSLNNISCDDEDDFLTRVTSNNYHHSSNPDYNRLHIARVTGQLPDPNGMMRMTNLDNREPLSPGVGSTVRARAKGLFAKSNEAPLLITFEYLFETADNDADSDKPPVCLIVYLSDVPELMSPLDPNRQDHYVEIGRVYPPRQGRPGSVGSGQFAEFHKYADPGALEFVRGTRVELELCGPNGTRILINNWDPQFQCPADICMNFVSNGLVEPLDLLPVIGECGGPAQLGADGSGSECADSPVSCDGYVDSRDIPAFEWAMRNHGTKMNLCPTNNGIDRSLPLHIDENCGIACTSVNSVAAQTTRLVPQVSQVPVRDDLQRDFAVDAAESTSRSHPFGVVPSLAVQSSSVAPVIQDNVDLLILGKPKWESKTDQFGGRLWQERLYGLNIAQATVQETDLVHTRCYVRLIRDPQGPVYAIGIDEGVFALDTPGDADGSLVKPCRVKSGDLDVYIGLQAMEDLSYGSPIWDMAFDPVDSNTVYVVPVVVKPPAENAPAYLAAARLRLSETGEEPAVTALYHDREFFDPCNPDNPNLFGLREIEVDDVGNVYVLNVHRRNASSTLWKYTSDGVRLRRENLAAPVDPIGLCISNEDDTLYVGSGQYTKSEPKTTHVYRFAANDLKPGAEMTIWGMEQISDITKGKTGDLWVLGFNVDREGTLDALDDWGKVSQSFYEARIAHVRLDQETATAGPVEGGSDLTLPLSVLWMGKDN